MCKYYAWFYTIHMYECFNLSVHRVVFAERADEIEKMYIHIFSIGVYFPPSSAVIEAFCTPTETARKYSIQYTTGGYGFTLAGTRPVFISHLEDGGAAKVGAACLC